MTDGVRDYREADHAKTWFTTPYKECEGYSSLKWSAVNIRIGSSYTSETVFEIANPSFRSAKPNNSASSAN
jgi:hypothetical protein